MGMSYEVYIGPYLEIKDKVVETKVTMPVTCLEHENERGQFCSICGSKREVREITVSQEVDLEDIFDCKNLYQCDFPSDRPFSIYLANTNNIGIVIQEDDLIHPLKEDWQKTELEKFNEHCKDTMKQLDKHEFEYEICFGIIAYWS